MTKMRQLVVLALAACTALMALSWFLLVSPKRTEAAELREQATVQQQNNASLETRLQVLRAQSAQLPAEQAELARIATKIPERPSLPTLIRALTAAAAEADVELTGITPQTPELVAPAAADPATTATTADGAAAAPAPAGAAGQLARIPLSITVTGGYFSIVQFVRELEELPRALRVSNLGMAPDAGAAAEGAQQGEVLSATLTGEVFLAPVPTAGAAVPATGTAPGAPAAGAPVPPAAPSAPSAAGGSYR